MLGRRRHEQTDVSIESSLDRLLLCNQIRELADYQKPVMVKELSPVHRLLFRIAKPAHGSLDPKRPRIGIWRRILIYPPIIVLLRLLLYQWSFRHMLVDTVSLICRNILYPQLQSSEITGYVTSTDKEEPLMRVCWLLRVMRYYGICIEFLIQRFNSGLPTAQTRQWLSLFLQEIGDTKAASMLSPSTGLREVTHPVCSSIVLEQSSSSGPKWPRLKYGLVITTLSDSDVFRSSLLSLLGSKFPGEIVVLEESPWPERTCESFCGSLPVKYIKCGEWYGGTTATLNAGIEQLSEETDIVLYTHNDILWSPCWFDQLNNAWERVYDLDKVKIINLGFLQFRQQRSDSVLYELFIRGKYEDLIWILRSMRHIPTVMPQVADLQSEDMGRLFGLGRDFWNEHLDRLCMQSGRIAPATSFPMQTWRNLERNLGGFDSGMPFLFDTELHYYCLQNQKWNLWLNNEPLIHMRSADVDSLPQDKGRTFRQKKNEGLINFSKKHGWDIYHVLFTFFSETAIIYHDDIIKAVNELRFSDIDFVFDDFFERLKNKRLSNCELTWCLSRNTCPYQESKEGAN